MKGKILLGISLAMALTAAVYGAFASEISYKNEIRTGSVEVQIRQYEETENGRVPVTPGTVLANQNVSYIPEVTNLRAPGYVRVKVEIIPETSGKFAVTQKNIYGVDEDWVLRGSYFYYTKPMAHMETQEIFRGIRIPEEWSEETASGFRVKLTVDGIQSANFTPDFQADFPWGDIEIQEEKNVDNITYREAVSSGEAKSVLRFSAENGLETNIENLFGEFSYFMAGDAFGDRLNIENTAKYPVKISFRTNGIKTALIERAELRIGCEEKTVYDGPLTAAPLNEYVPLLKLEPGQTGEFNFEVRLPDGSENEYSILEDDVIWEFKAEPVSDGGIVQSGDDRTIMPYLWAAVVAIVFMVLPIAGKRGRKK